MVFLDTLLSFPEFSTTVISCLGSIYGLSTSQNAEIRFRYGQLALKSNFRPHFSKVIEFLGEQGRMKYVRPLYRSLNKCDAELAKETFARFKKTYHPIAVAMIAKDLGVKV